MQHFRIIYLLHSNVFCINKIAVGLIQMWNNRAQHVHISYCTRTHINLRTIHALSHFGRIFIFVNRLILEQQWPLNGIQLVCTIAFCKRRKHVALFRHARLAHTNERICYLILLYTRHPPTTQLHNQLNVFDSQFFSFVLLLLNKFPAKIKTKSG